jgi:hypothetical protein
MLAQSLRRTLQNLNGLIDELILRALLIAKNAISGGIVDMTSILLACAQVKSGHQYAEAHLNIYWRLR